MGKLLGLAEAHFLAHRRRTKWAFFWRISLEGSVVALAVVLVIAIVTHETPGRPAIERVPPFKLIVVACLLAPLIETALLQALPVMLARVARASFWLQVAASAVPFAALHFTEGVSVGFGAGAVGGLYLGFTYVRWREESFAHAFFMTAGTHAARNALAVAIALAASSAFESGKAPNQAPEPTPGSVTDRADARSAPAPGVAHL